MPVLVIVVLALLVLAALVASTADSAASAMQAQAAIEAAQAAQVSAAGQAATSAGLLMIIGAVGMLLTAVLAIGLFYLVRRRAEKPRWAPGPNAGFRRLDDGDAPYPYPQIEQRSQDQKMEQLFNRMIMMRLLGISAPPSNQPQIQPPENQDPFQEW